jgi:hypothetical protein
MRVVAIRNCLLVAAIFVACVANSAYADIVYWNFGTTAANAAPTSETGPIAGFSVGSFSVGNSLGTVTTPITSQTASNVYTGASAQMNLGNAFRTGGLNISTSGYFTFSVNNTTSDWLQISDFDFGMRSTGTGPTSFALRSSTDNYATDLLTGTAAGDSVWAFKNNSISSTSSVALIPASTIVTYRLYGYAGTGNAQSGTVNGKIDDVTATFIAAVPEAPAYLFGALVCGVFGIVYGGRRFFFKTTDENDAVEG